ncbi:MAG: hypothetical protein ACFFAN_06265 [Promethearchaeota archaeon]
MFLIQISLTLNFLGIKSYAFEEEIEPEYGPAPDIDGEIDGSVKEWKNATKEDIELEDLPIELWVMQNDSDIYICVQMELEYPNDESFLGILISESSSDDDDDFVDAKIIQFSELNEDDQEFEYLDYYIDDDDFDEDDENEGDGAAELDDHDIIWEICFPVNNSDAEDDKEDVFLDYGEEYAFKIVYGEGTNYPDDIKASGTVLISIEYPPKIPIDLVYKITILVLLIIIFCSIGALYGLYIFKIIKLKGKVKRVKK